MMASSCTLPNTPTIPLQSGWKDGKGDVLVEVSAALSNDMDMGVYSHLGMPHSPLYHVDTEDQYKRILPRQGNLEDPK